jgi:hypothetical protein
MYVMGFCTSKNGPRGSQVQLLPSMVQSHVAVWMEITLYCILYLWLKQICSAFLCFLILYVQHRQLRDSTILEAESWLRLLIIATAKPTQANPAREYLTKALSWKGMNAKIVMQKSPASYAKYYFIGRALYA